MSALGDALAAVADVFAEAGVRWLVFGAQAVAVRGAPRATQDVDVTAEIPPHRLDSVVASLRAAGVEHRYPDIADELLHAGAVLPMRHSSGMEVDIVLAGSGLEALALDRATAVVIDGVSVPVAHATDLVVMKVLAGRGKDLDDLRGLLAGGEVDVEEARNLVGQLEAALAQSDLLPLLEAALRDVRR